MVVAYTYFVGWTKLNLWYYGVRYKKGCCPSDFFTTYFTSSKLVHALMLTHGLPDVRQIRKTFTNVKQSLVWEQTVLRRMRVLRKEQWLNQNISGAINFTPAMRQIMSDRKKGRTWLIKDGKKTLVRKELVDVLLKEGYVKWKPDNSGKLNGMWGKHHTKSARNKIRQSKIGVCNMTEAGKQRKSKFMEVNNPMHNDIIRKKHKEKMRALKTASKPVFWNGKKYMSVREANKHHTHIKYSTLAYWCAKNKNGWSYDTPAVFY